MCSLYLLSVICLSSCSGKLPAESVYIEDLILLGWLWFGFGDWRLVSHWLLVLFLHLWGRHAWISTLRVGGFVLRHPVLHLHSFLPLKRWVISHVSALLCLKSLLYTHYNTAQKLYLTEDNTGVKELMEIMEIYPTQKDNNYSNRPFLLKKTIKQHLTESLGHYLRHTENESHCFPSSTHTLQSGSLSVCLWAACCKLLQKIVSVKMPKRSWL